MVAQPRRQIIKKRRSIRLMQINRFVPINQIAGIGLASPAFISIRSPDQGRKAIFRGHRDRARQATARVSSNAGSRRISSCKRRVYATVPSAPTNSV